LVRSQPGQIVQETLSQKKPFTKIGLVEWLKVKALSSSHSTAKKKYLELRITGPNKIEEIQNPIPQWLL
jgi:hypothetical protein